MDRAWDSLESIVASGVKLGQLRFEIHGFSIAGLGFRCRVGRERLRSGGFPSVGTSCVGVILSCAGVCQLAGGAAGDALSTSVCLELPHGFCG